MVLLLFSKIRQSYQWQKRHSHCISNWRTHRRPQIALLRTDRNHQVVCIGEILTTCCALFCTFFDYFENSIRQATRRTSMCSRAGYRPFLCLVRWCYLWSPFLQPAPVPVYRYSTFLWTANDIHPSPSANRVSCNGTAFYSKTVSKAERDDECSRSMLLPEFMAAGAVVAANGENKKRCNDFPRIVSGSSELRSHIEGKRVFGRYARTQLAFNSHDEQDRVWLAAGGEWIKLERR